MNRIIDPKSCRGLFAIGTVALSFAAAACNSERGAITAEPEPEANRDGTAVGNRDQCADTEEPSDPPDGPDIDTSLPYIDLMLAECYSHPLPVPGVKQFVVPRRYYAQILDHFRDARPDSTPKLLKAEIGTIRIIDKGGCSVRVCWFWEAHFGRMSFSYNGMRYLASGKKFGNDETLAFDALIRRINDEMSAAH
ncbi:MAG TPA: hypothetical protein VHV55_15775 [Pirellulales bacterium]|jgi:hypothetical protein|nr:hypothetical protein [Pirellulales bacterium]